MVPEKYQSLLREFEPDGDSRLLLAIARELEKAGNLEGAATFYDRAYGLDPDADDIRQGRARVLDQMAVVEHGLVFRYIPGGVFLMGREQSEPDERPLHPVWLSPYWLSDTPISWAAYCRLMNWAPPPEAFPRDYQPTEGFDRPAFHIYGENKIRLQYCEDRTTRARDWHSHAPGQTWTQAGQSVSAQELFGAPERNDADAPWDYDSKPMIAIGWQEAEEMAERITTEEVRYLLPSEAQWEKAARGGLIGARYAWGEAKPSHELCDFDRFHELSILPMRHFPPNGYGLYAMNGGIWEWTRDWYDADYYQHASETDPEGPATGEQKVLRGGSWTDCAEVMTVTFRMSHDSSSWRTGNWGAQLTPNFGFRLCRMVRGADPQAM